MGNSEEEDNFPLPRPATEDDSAAGGNLEEKQGHFLKKEVKPKESLEKQMKLAGEDSLSRTSKTLRVFFEIDDSKEEGVSQSPTQVTEDNSFDDGLKDKQSQFPKEEVKPQESSGKQVKPAKKDSLSRTSKTLSELLTIDKSEEEGFFRLQFRQQRVITSARKILRGSKAIFRRKRLSRKSHRGTSDTCRRGCLLESRQFA